MKEIWYTQLLLSVLGFKYFKRDVNAVKTNND